MEEKKQVTHEEEFQQIYVEFTLKEEEHNSLLLKFGLGMWLPSKKDSSWKGRVINSFTSGELRLSSTLAK